MYLVTVTLKVKQRLAMVVMLLAVTACGAIAVNSDYDTERQFSGLTTYAWMTPKQKLLQDPLVDNDLMNNRVRRSVGRRLTAQGFSEATGDTSADFLVTYHVSAETEYSVSNFHGSYGYYPCWACYGHRYGYGRDSTVRMYKRGTFMIDVVDPASSQLIWRGVAGRRLNSGTPQERDAYVDSIVTAILAQFPPGRVQSE
jgi:hypothetical protein